MLKNLIINIGGLDSEADLQRLDACLGRIDAIKKFDYNMKVNILSITYDDRELSHANFIYTSIEDCGFEVK